MSDSLRASSAIALRGLRKEFRIKSEHQKLSFLGGFGSRQAKRTLVALDSIDLDVPRGETLGIIGMNGSGKSTLLKIIAGIMNPTNGDVKVEGQIGSLIELGAGFHPELSGYENVYLNGTILGIKRSEIENLLPQIIEFAALESFMEMPVKHYSSGMQMRLGFAIAVQLRPDVLLLDETLSVGDAEFQSKALKAIRNYHDSGATTVMVSHDVFSIREYSNRVLWLDKGTMRMIGKPGPVVDAYLDNMMNMAGVESHQMLALNGDRMYIDAQADDSPVEITELKILNEEGQASGTLDHPKTITISIRYHACRPVKSARACVALYCRDTKALILEKDSERDGQPIRDLSSEGEIRFSLQSDKFYSDSFGVVAALYDPENPNHLWARATGEFDLIGHQQPTPDDFHYILAPCETYQHRENRP